MPAVPDVDPLRPQITGAHLEAFCALASMFDTDGHFAEPDDPEWVRQAAVIEDLFPREARQVRETAAGGWEDTDGYDVALEPLRNVVWDTATELSEDDMGVLARGEEPRARLWVVTLPDCPPDVLKVLAGDPEADIRWRVAKHDNVTIGTLQALKADSDMEVADEASRAQG